MSTNAEIARIFFEMAAVLELTGANSFRVSAHARVARTLADMTTDVADLVDDEKKLTAIDGIGAASAKKIIEFVATGGVEEHEKLLADVPEGLLELLEIPGLGPKTVKVLWEQAGVTDLASLEAAIAAGTLEKLPRMGAKTVQNIKQSIGFRSRSSERTRLGKALPAALEMVAALEAVAGVTRVAYAGSLRRGRETIGDIDLLASTTDPSALVEAFTTQPDVEKVMAAGDKKCSVRLARGLQVDLRLVDDEAFGAALLYFSGSKEHNVRLRERAIRMGLRLNEYGLFPAGGGSGDDDDGSADAGADTPPQERGIAPVAARTEAEIYAALDLPFIPPEMREDRGELDVDMASMPDLVEPADIRADLHAHTVASDGKMTIDELAAEAKARGYHTVAITDHSKSSAQAGGLSPERLVEHIAAVKAADARTEGITILAGSEVDILGDGHLDYDDELLAMLDIVVASPHHALAQEPAVATERLVRAIAHPLVHIIGHPTGRRINMRAGLAPDIPTLVAAAAKHDTALEINANPLRLDLRDTHVRAAVDAGALIAINTDAHRPVQFDLMPYGILTARRGWLPKAQCINTWSAEKLRGWLSR